MRVAVAPLALFVVVSGAVACTPTAAPPNKGDQRVKVPTPPSAAEGLQFVMPDTVIKNGADVVMCFVPEGAPTVDVFAKSFESVHADIAVHVDAMLSLIPRDAPDVFDCTDFNLTATLTPLFLPGAALPDGFSVRIPAAHRIVIRTHYVNKTGVDVTVADVARFLFAAADATEVSTYVVTTTQVDVPQGLVSTRVDCAPLTDVTLLSLAAHMGPLGKSLVMTHDNDELYRVDTWNAGMVDEPPVSTYDVAAPHVFHAGDAVSLTCTWDNTTDHEIFFPEELCASFSYAFPADPEGFTVCGHIADVAEGEGEGAVGEGEGEGAGEGEGEGAAAGEGEGEGADQSACPGIPPPNNSCLPGCGNDKFVGQPCTEGGGECSGHGFGNATFCTVDFDASVELQMCTKPCVVDSQCGDAAVCIGDPADPNSQKGCVPVACSGP